MILYFDCHLETVVVWWHRPLSCSPAQQTLRQAHLLLRFSPGISQSTGWFQRFGGALSDGGLSSDSVDTGVLQLLESKGRVRELERLTGAGR